MLLLALPIGMLAQGTTWQSATEIVNGGSGSGTLSNGQTEAWFKVTVPENGTTSLTITPQGELSVNYLRFYALGGDGNLQKRCEVFVERSQKNLTDVAVAAGTYYVGVFHRGGSGTFTLDYGFTATSVNFPNDAEPDDTWQQAAALDINGTLTGQMGYYYWGDRDTEDYFKIDIPENGSVSLTVTPNGELSINYLRLYALGADGNLKQRRETFVERNQTTLTVTDVASGTYYVRLNHRENQGGYTLTSRFTPLSATFPHDAEPNDTWQQAVAMDINGTVTGQLGYLYWSDTDTEDYFKIEVPENGSVDLTVTPNGNLSINFLSLYALGADGNLKNRREVFVEQSQTKLAVVDVSPGTYYVRLNHRGGEGGYTLTSQFTPLSATFPNDAEPNDTWQQAADLGINSSLTGQMGYFYWDDRDTEDYFKIEVPGNGIANLTVTPNGELSINYLGLYALGSDGNLKKRGEVFVEQNQSTLTIDDVAQGTYYVRLNHRYNQGGYTLAYQFEPLSAKYPDDKEPNGSWQEASLLKRGKYTTGHLGYLYWDDTDKEDWYKIEVPRNGTVNLTVTPHDQLSMNYIKLYALGADGNLHNRRETYIEKEEVTLQLVDAAPGTYYISVNQRGEEGAYTLKYVFTQPLYASDAEPNDTWQEAVALAKDATVSGHLGYLYWDDTDKVDWYKVELPAKGKMDFFLKPLDNLSINYIKLYDANQSNKKEVFVERNQVTLSVDNMEAGTYYVSVNHRGGEGAYLLAYSATLGYVEPQDVLPDEPQEQPDPGTDPQTGGDVIDEFTLWYTLDIGGTVGYKLSEKPQVRLLGAETTVTSSRGVMTFETQKIWKFTLTAGDATPVLSPVLPASPEAQGSVSRSDDALVFSGCRPGEPVYVYTAGGRIYAQHRIGSDGGLELSLGTLRPGLYIVKAGSVNIKFLKK